MANVRFGNTERLVSASDEGLWLIEAWPSIDALLADPASMSSKRERLTQEVRQGRRILPEAAQVLPAVLNPGKVICIGLNYRRHAEETGMPIPTIPVVFSKFSDSVAASGDPVAVPSETQRFDYEGELTIVIGERTHRVSEGQALSRVLGYCNGNDLSARDLQMATSQWLLGKTGVGMAPIGPFVRTCDDIPNPNQLGIKTYRNGKLVQDSNTSDMIFSCEEIIAYLSRHMVLMPGDIIMTGTPEGVILGLPHEEQEWLHDGDHLTVAIDGLGQLDTTITAR